MGITRPTITDDDGSQTTGTVYNAAFWTTVFDNIDNNPSGWTLYTPTWAGSVSNPAIGDGVLTGRYAKTGKIVLFEVSLTIGALTTLGSGYWTLSLPSTSSIATGLVFPASILDSGTRRYAAWGTLNSTSNFVVQYEQQTGNNVGAAIPITWATGDILLVSGWYLEA